MLALLMLGLDTQRVKVYNVVNSVIVTRADGHRVESLIQVGTSNVYITEN